MIQKKVCMIGAFATGKTSLAARFVKSIFSAKYLTTVGVKIDKKVVEIDGSSVTLILWDLHGEDELQRVRASYLRGSAGYILVVDATRRATLDTAIELRKLAAETLDGAPFVVAVNKNDLKDDWDLQESRLQQLSSAGWTILKTSAKSGEGVEELFTVLTRMITAREKGIGAS